MRILTVCALLILWSVSANAARHPLSTPEEKKALEKQPSGINLVGCTTLPAIQEAFGVYLDRQDLKGAVRVVNRRSRSELCRYFENAEYNIIVVEFRVMVGAYRLTFYSAQMASDGAVYFLWGVTPMKTPPEDVPTQ